MRASCHRPPPPHCAATGKINPVLREQAVQEYRREFGLDVHTGK